MQNSISKFPIILEHRPGYSRRHQHGSTFVRAHVMSKYHRERKVNQSSIGLPIATVGFDSLMNELARTPENSCPSKRLPVVKFVEYAGRRPKAGRKEVQQQITVTEISEKRGMEKNDLAVRYKMSHIPSFEPGLQLRDPREQLSAKFGLVFQAYSKHLDDRQLPLDILTETWLPVAFTDPVLFHAIMFNFSQHLYSLCSLDQNKSYLLHHKVHALRQISSRISNPKLAASDAVIASILCLVAHDLLNKDCNALTAHVNGLRKLISLRGGVDALGLNKTLKTVYLSYELLLSTCFESWCTDIRPSPIVVHDPMSPNRCNILTFGTNVINLDADGSGGTTQQVSESLEYILTSYKTSTPSTVSAGVENYIISPQPADTPNPSSAQTSISEHTIPAIYLAIHLDSSLPGVLTTSYSSSNLTPLIKKLKYHLNLSPLNNLWQPIPGALIWCLLVGVEASQGMPEYPWFVANLMKAVTALTFVDWEGVKSCMQQLVNRGATRG